MLGSSGHGSCGTVRQCEREGARRGMGKRGMGGRGATHVLRECKGTGAPSPLVMHTKAKCLVAARWAVYLQGTTTAGRVGLG